MKRLLATMCVAAVIGLPGARAQDGDEGTSLADRSPSQNVQGGNVSARSPGTWIRAARARHVGLIGERLNAARFGISDAGGDEPQGESGGASAGSTGLNVNDLLNLAEQFGGIGNLGNLAGSLGGGLDEMLGAFTGGTDLRSASITPDDSLDAVTKIDDSANRSQVREEPAFGGAIARLPDKSTFAREQAQGDERKFVTRLVDSLAQTFFTAVAVGMQAPAFIEDLKDLLRPVFAPPPPEEPGNGDGTGGGGDTGTIDDLPPGGPGGTQPPDSIVFGDLPPAPGTAVA